MNCPQCGTSVAEGTSICPQCDHILDASFLDEPSPPPPPHRPTGARPAPNRAPARPARSSGARPAAEATQIKSVEELERPPRRPTASRPRPAPVPSPVEEPLDDDDLDAAELELSHGSGSGMAEPEELLADAKIFVRELPSSDKLAFLGAAATVLFCFLPWKETAAEGDIIGFVSLGFLAFLVNVAVMVAVFVRVREAMPQLNPLVPWLVQLGCVCFGIIWCFVFMKVSTDGRPVQALIGNEMVAVSRPSFGVYLSLLSELVALAGTLLGLKEKPA